MKSALIISGNLAQDHEFIFPYYRLLEENFEVSVCLNEGSKVKGILGTDIPPNKDQKILQAEEVNVDHYNFLVLPGGIKAMEKVRQNKLILKIIKQFDDQKKTIACICSGAQLLISAKVVKGRNISGYYSMMDDIINAGANYVDKESVIDENIITTAHYKDMGAWMKSALEVFYKKNP